MAHRDLDRLDRKILEILQQDGRITNQDLSQMVETTEDWIESHSGIRERHIASHK